jgi:hypothetical protein
MSAMSRNVGGILLVVAAALWQACATARPPSAAVLDAARLAPSYSARLGVSLKGPRGRARVTALAAFARPDALRVEVPGPAGARLIFVARDDRILAVFPGERAVYSGHATAAEVEAALGVALTPQQIMDVLLGTASPHLSEARVEWGPRLPQRIRGRLSDGTSLSIKVSDAEAPAVLRESVFSDPYHAGFRSIDAEEARNIWARR